MREKRKFYSKKNDGQKLETELEYTKYTITKNTEFGDLVEKLTKLVNLFNNKKHIKVLKQNSKKLVVNSTPYGFTMLRLIFWHPNYSIEKNNV